MVKEQDNKKTELKSTEPTEKVSKSDMPKEKGWWSRRFSREAPEGEKAVEATTGKEEKSDMPKEKGWWSRRFSREAPEGEKVVESTKKEPKKGMSKEEVTQLSEGVKSSSDASRTLSNAGVKHQNQVTEVQHRTGVERS